MNAIDEKTINTLRDLIEICRDGQRGFETAGKDARAGELTSLFLAYAGERADYAQELQEQVGALGGDAEKAGSVSGTLHRGWINLKTALAGNEPHAVLVECERGEDAAVQAYREALNGDLDPESRRIVARQARGIQAAHDRIKILRDSVLYAKA
jgi:uncharacterized protein (TIGR02284 family)